MKFLIVYNALKPDADKISLQSKDILENSGAKSDIIEFNDFIKFENLEALLNDVKAVVVIGGDGTIIKTAKLVAMFDLAVLSINAGRIGYLAAIENTHLELLNLLINDDYKVENRMMIKAEKWQNGDLIDTAICFNDAVVSKDAFSSVVDIDLNLDSDTVHYRADGFIVATPTGSTAYSMSAGGPIIDPTLECIVLTPLCPYTLLNRSIVVNTKTDISFNITEKNKASLFADGQRVFDLDENSTVKIKVCETFAKFIKPQNDSVYKVLSEKTRFH